jgi:hypothetical protein
MNGLISMIVIEALCVCGETNVPVRVNMNQSNNAQALPIGGTQSATHRAARAFAPVRFAFWIQAALFSRTIPFCEADRKL